MGLLSAHQNRAAKAYKSTAVDGRPKMVHPGFFVALRLEPDERLDSALRLLRYPDD